MPARCLSLTSLFLPSVWINHIFVRWETNNYKNFTWYKILITFDRDYLWIKIKVSSISEVLQIGRFNLDFISLSILWIARIFKSFRRGKLWKLKSGRSFNRRSKENWQAWRYRTVQSRRQTASRALELSNHWNHPIFILNSEIPSLSIFRQIVSQSIPRII